MNSSQIVCRLAGVGVLTLALSVIGGCNKSAPDGNGTASGQPETPAPNVEPIAPAAVVESFDNLPELDTVMTDALDFMGGQDAFDAVDSFMLKGRVFTILGDGTIEVHVARPGRVFMRNTYPGGSFVSFGSDGETTWTINPLKGKFQLVETETMNQALRNFSYWWEFIQLRNTAQKVSVVSRTQFNEEECFKVRAVRSPTHEEFWFFAIADGRPLGLEYNHFRYREPTLVTITFSNWTEMSGIKVFGRTFIEQLEQGTDINMDELEINKVDQTVFILPDDVQKLVAEGATPEPATP